MKTYAFLFPVIVHCFFQFTHPLFFKYAETAMSQAAILRQRSYWTQFELVNSRLDGDWCQEGGREGENRGLEVPGFDHEVTTKEGGRLLRGRSERRRRGRNHL